MTNQSRKLPPAGYYANPDDAERAKIIEKLKSECRKAIGKKKSFQFYPVCNFLMIKPTTSVVVDGYKINLRYSDQFDTPFVDEQKTNEAVRVEMVNLSLEEPVPIPTNEMCKLMYLLLHPNNHENLDQSNTLLMENATTFYLEDLEKEAKDQMAMYELKDEAVDLCKKGDIDDVKAAYYVISGEDVSQMTNIELRTSLRTLSENYPEDVIEAFSDSKTRARFTYQTAIILTHLFVSEDGTDLKSGKTNNTILSIVTGADMETEFATWCTSTDKGKDFLEVLKEDLNK